MCFIYIDIICIDNILKYGSVINETKKKNPKSSILIMIIMVKSIVIINRISDESDSVDRFTDYNNKNDYSVKVKVILLITVIN